MSNIKSGVIILYTEDTWIMYGDIGSQGRFFFFELEPKENA